MYILICIYIYTHIHIHYTPLHSTPLYHITLSYIKSHPGYCKHALQRITMSYSDSDSDSHKPGATITCKAVRVNTEVQKCDDTYQDYNIRFINTKSQHV